MSGVAQAWCHRRWARGSVWALVLVAFVYLTHLYMVRGMARGVAPPLAGPTLSGAPVSLATLRGRPVLVHFWATWCPVCELQQGTIQALARDHDVITVAMQSGGTAAVRSYLGERGLSFPVIVDQDGRLAARFGVRAVPASFVLDGRGHVRFIEAGYSTGLGLRARLWLARW